MKRLYQIICCVFLGMMLLVGVISLVDRDAEFSEREERELAQKPELTVSSILDGSYFRSLEIYYADTFPGREWLLGEYEDMERFYDFGEAPEEE